MQFHVIASFLTDNLINLVDISELLLDPIASLNLCGTEIPRLENHTLSTLTSDPAKGLPILSHTNTYLKWKICILKNILSFSSPLHASELCASICT